MRTPKNIIIKIVDGENGKFSHKVYLEKMYKGVPDWTKFKEEAKLISRTTALKHRSELDKHYGYDGITYLIEEV